MHIYMYIQGVTKISIQGVHKLRQQTFWPLPKIQKIKTSIATYDLIG